MVGSVGKPTLYADLPWALFGIRNEGRHGALSTDRLPYHPWAGPCKHSQSVKAAAGKIGSTYKPIILTIALALMPAPGLTDPISCGMMLLQIPIWCGGIPDLDYQSATQNHGLYGTLNLIENNERRDITERCCGPSTEQETSPRNRSCIAFALT